MKTKLVIICFLIISLLGAFTLKAHSQYSNKLSNVITITSDTIKDNSSDQLIADETTISYTKTMAKIDCSNETIAKLITQKFDQIIRRLSWAKKNRQKWRI